MNNEENNREEKQEFFKNINNFFIKSGIAAATVKGIANNIQTKADAVKKDAERKAIVGGLSFFGAVLVFYGLAQWIGRYFDVSEYTNLGLGLLFLAMALVFNIIKK